VIGVSRRKIGRRQHAETLILDEEGSELIIAVSTADGDDFRILSPKRMLITKEDFAGRCQREIGRWQCNQGRRSKLGHRRPLISRGEKCGAAVNRNRRTGIWGRNLVGGK
jgi:hypothetical protein